MDLLVWSVFIFFEGPGFPGTDDLFEPDRRDLSEEAVSCISDDIGDGTAPT